MKGNRRREKKKKKKKKKERKKKGLRGANVYLIKETSHRLCAREIQSEVGSGESPNTFSLTSSPRSSHSPFDMCHDSLSLGSGPHPAS